MSANIDLIVKRLLDPQFGADTTERLLMGSAADAIRYLQGELAAAQAKAGHLAKQEADIRAAYEIVRADSMHLVRESKRLEREWIASESRVSELQAEVDRMKGAVADEVDRLRPHYLSLTSIDAARRQMLDHFSVKFPRALTAQKKGDAS